MMSAENESQGADPQAAPSGAAAGQRSPLQFGLRGLLLLTALVAVWATYFLNRRAIGFLESRIAVLRSLAAELSVDDTSRISIVKQPPLWHDESKWDVFLPTAGYRLCLATEEISAPGADSRSANGALAPAEACVEIAAGHSRLEFSQARTEQGWTLTVRHDNRDVLRIDKPTGWNESIGSSGGGYFQYQQELAADERVVLFHRRFMTRSDAGRGQAPRAPAAGVLLWIEKADQGNTPVDGPG